MTIERSGGPWAGATYNGFSGGAAGGPPQPAPAPRRRGPSRGALFGGVAAAVAAGVLFGVFARPELGSRSETPKPTAVASTATVPVEVAPVTPAPAPVATDRLEVLSPETTQAAARFTPPPPPPLPAERETAQAPEGLRELQAARELEAPAAPPAPQVVEPPPARVAEAPRPPQPVRPSFRCPSARTPAEDMVCTDPRLARLDQRLDRAYQRALASGVPVRDLREDQNDWLRIREDAARYSPDAVASIYRQRIAELDDIAAGPDN